jgi:hypothetical protein
MNYRQFVSSRMTQRPKTVAPAIFMKDVAKEWKTMQENQSIKSSARAKHATKKREKVNVEPIKPTIIDNTPPPPPNTIPIPNTPIGYQQPTEETYRKAHLAKQKATKAVNVIKEAFRKKKQTKHSELWNPVHEELAEKERQRQEEAVTKIQNLAKRRQAFKQTKHSELWNPVHEELSQQQQEKAATKIQANVRRHQQREGFKKLKKATTIIQSIVRERQRKAKELQEEPGVPPPPVIGGPPQFNQIVPISPIVRTSALGAPMGYPSLSQSDKDWRIYRQHQKPPMYKAPFVPSYLTQPTPSSMVPYQPSHTGPLGAPKPAISTPVPQPRIEEATPEEVAQARRTGKIVLPPSVEEIENIEFKKRVELSRELMSPDLRLVTPDMHNKWITLYANKHQITKTEANKKFREILGVEDFKTKNSREKLKDHEKMKDLSMALT